MANRKRKTLWCARCKQNHILADFPDDPSKKSGKRGICLYCVPYTDAAKHDEWFMQSYIRNRFADGIGWLIDQVILDGRIEGLLDPPREAIL